MDFGHDRPVKRNLKTIIRYGVRLVLPGRFLRDFRHKRQMMKFYAQFIRRGDLCFDIGANIGKNTEVFLKLGAKVVCVEPQETCLRQLWSRFGHNERVIIVSKAVGESEGYAQLMICEDAPTISTMSDKWRNEGRFAKDHKWTKVAMVPITTLDNLIHGYGLPDFCKIDVEGFEVQVLKGLSQPIRLISFEFTREFFEDARECIERLQTLGEVEVDCMVGESMTLFFHNFVPPSELLLRLNSWKDELLWGDIFVRFI